MFSHSHLLEEAENESYDHQDQQDVRRIKHAMFKTDGAVHLSPVEERVECVADRSRTGNKQQCT